MTSLLSILVLLSWPDLPEPTIRWALAQVETGGRDRARGAVGEVSRFQIRPGLWRRYGLGLNPSNPEHAWRVSRRLLSDRAARFRRMTGRDPGAWDLYVLWNAPGHYEAVKWDRRRVRKVIAERAQRFCNLVETGGPR